MTAEPTPPVDQEQRRPEQEQHLLDPDRNRRAQERTRLDEEKKRERYVWYYLAYFLFGIHIVAFVMIYAVMHAK